MNAVLIERAHELGFREVPEAPMGDYTPGRGLLRAVSATARTRSSCTAPFPDAPNFRPCWAMKRSAK